MLFVSGCQTIVSEQSWPRNLPERQKFVESYDKSVQAGEKVISLERHLTWIKRFYQGTTLYPQGWNKVSSQTLDSLTNQGDIKNVTPRLMELGFKISSEWAKDNSCLLYTSPSPRDQRGSRMPSSA